MLRGISCLPLFFLHKLQWVEDSSARVRYVSRQQMVLQECRWSNSNTRRWNNNLIKLRCSAQNKRGLTSSGSSRRFRIPHLAILRTSDDTSLAVADDLLRCDWLGEVRLIITRAVRRPAIATLLWLAGSVCDVNIDECSPVMDNESGLIGTPCLNNGTCIDLVNDYRCDCTTGFTGA